MYRRKENQKSDSESDGHSQRCLSKQSHGDVSCVVVSVLSFFLFPPPPLPSYPTSRHCFESSHANQERHLPPSLPPSTLAPSPHPPQPLLLLLLLLLPLLLPPFLPLASSPPLVILPNRAGARTRRRRDEEKKCSSHREKGAVAAAGRVRLSGDLDAELGAAPVTALAVVANRVVRAEADPLRDRPVLPGNLGQRLLRPERLV